MSEMFDGFPGEAFTFFRQLTRHNNRAWFQAHREVYERACREPMKQLVAALGSNPARTKITRINRDMRFARGQEPYRTHIATVVGAHYLWLQPTDCTRRDRHLHAGRTHARAIPERHRRQCIRIGIAADRSGASTKGLSDRHPRAADGGAARVSRRPSAP